MRNRFANLAALVAVVLLTPWPAAGQAAGNFSDPPRTADGRPDLQGVWANYSATPLERPDELAGKDAFTDEEVAELQSTADELFNGETDAAFGDSVFHAVLAGGKAYTSRDARTGNYNHFWVVDREFDDRTSLVVDPPDGRLPPLTPGGPETSGGEKRIQT